MDAETFTIQSVLDTMNKSLKDSGASVELKRRDERGNVVPAYVQSVWPRHLLIVCRPPNTLCMCVCVWWQLLRVGILHTESLKQQPKWTLK